MGKCHGKKAGNFYNLAQIADSGVLLATKKLTIDNPFRKRMVILQDRARIWQNLARRNVALQEFLPEYWNILQDNHLFLQESCINA